LELKKVKESDKFPSKHFDDSALEEVTYSEFGECIQNFGAGLRSLGMEPIPQLKEGESFDEATGPFVMVIFEDTCKQWSTALHGAMSQSITIATCYATLGEDAVIAAVNETQASALLLNWKKAERFSELAKQMPSLKTIIASTNEMPAGTATPLPKRGSGIKIVSSDEVMEIGAEHPCDAVPPKPHDVAVIMYTSGSTGKPKGVVMKHSSMVAAASSMARNINLTDGQETYISYLPLAHVLALQAENAMLNSGATICHSDPRELVKAMPMFKPTLHAGVPKVWELFQAGLLKKLEGGSPVMKTIFDVAFEWKSLALSMGLDCPLFNKFFGLIAKKMFGGRLKLAISGGGPLSKKLHNFCRVVFGVEMIQGYALTETCVGGCFQARDDPRCGIVGPPVTSVEICLQSEPEIKDSAGLPYLHTDTADSKGQPVIGRGEICMRGPCISSGYYKMPEKTAEEYDEEGWFHTGDVGQFTTDGVIQIVDRKKNLVKLKGGEYVAVENMESSFTQSPFAMSVCVIATGDLDGPLSIVRTENEYLANWAKEQGIAFDSVHDLVDNKEVKKAILASMLKFGKEAGLTSLELRMKDCELVTDIEWLPGTGMTATMKIDRKQIHIQHKDKLHALLERHGALPQE